MTLALATRDHVNVPLRNHQHNTLSIHTICLDLSHPRPLRSLESRSLFVIMASTPEFFLSLNSASGTSTPTTNGTVKAKNIVVFSGGSAANNLVDVFETVREDKKCPLSYVIPISDNGGSSSELIRVFGGPGKYQEYQDDSTTNE